MNPLIIIPTYNEIENLHRMIHALMALDHEVDFLVVDDDSPDVTGKAADELTQTFQNRVFTLHRQG
ncbi:MAG: glycosyltransferase, partial [Bacteroidota bacterium]|nr:glycosyltransferase [Bacteroidota bacterium]